MIKENCKWRMDVPVISTQHITEQDSAILSVGGDIPGLMGPIYSGEGFLLCIDDAQWDSGLEGDDDDRHETWIGLGLSKQFCKLMITAQLEGFVYLRLDSDGCIIPGLPRFEW